MSRKNERKPKANGKGKKNEKENKAKKPVTGKTVTGRNKSSSAGKTATGKQSSSGQATPPAKRTPAKRNAPKTRETQPKEQRILIHGVIAEDENGKSVFPKKFPFWARLKIGKKRTTLVIDEETIKNKKSKKVEPHFVQRESIHPHGDGSNVKGYEKIEPNPDPTDKEPMYLKRPTKLPKRLFKPHNRQLDMPEHLRERYDKNNHKNDK